MSLPENLVPLPPHNRSENSRRPRPWSDLVARSHRAREGQGPASDFLSEKLARIRSQPVKVHPCPATQ